MDIKEAIKQLEDLKKDRLSFATGDKEHDNIFLKDVQAIEIVLSNLEALADMQKTANKELDNAKKINEEHKRENGELRKKVKELEEENLHWRGQYYLVTRKIGVIPIKKIKEIVDECIPKKANIITNEMEYTPNTNANSYLTQQILELLQESEDK